MLASQHERPAQNPQKMKPTRLLATIILIAIAAHFATAAPGDLDLTFGGTGKVITDLSSRYDRAHGVAVQSDSKIVVVVGTSWASTGFAVLRYNADGSLDSGFGDNGKITTAIEASSVAIQADGKIVVAGNGVARYHADGNLDTSFNGTGMVTSIGGGGRSVALQADQKIVVAGSARIGSTDDFAVVRYNTNGSLDLSFNATGKKTIDFASSDDQAYGVAVQSDQKIVIAGYSSAGAPIDGSGFALLRLNGDGTLDTTFNGTGKVNTVFGNQAEGRSVALQEDGKIVVAGLSSNGSTWDFAVVRYNSNGSLDTSFNATGKVTTPIGRLAAGQSVAIQTDRKLLVAGYALNASQDFALVRYRPDGSLDPSFGNGGLVTTDIGGSDDYGSSVAIQPDAKIVVAGYSQISTSNAGIASVRYEGNYPDTDGDGISDIYETGTGIYVSPEDTGTSPTNPDTDGDGLTDGQEVNTYHSNPNIKDTDGDGFDDGFEVSTGFSPTSAASIPDAQSSIRTAAEYRFNAALGISYRIEASTDLVTWATIETNIIGTGGVITRFYSIEGQPKRYFRSRRN